MKLSNVFAFAALSFLLFTFTTYSTAADLSAVSFQVLRVMPESPDASLTSSPINDVNDPEKLIAWMKTHGTINVIAEGSIPLTHGVGSISTMKVVEPEPKAPDMLITPAGMKVGMELKVITQLYEESVLMQAAFELSEKVGIRTYTSPSNKSINFPVLKIFRTAPSGLTELGKGLVTYSYREGEFTALVLRPLQ